MSMGMGVGAITADGAVSCDFGGGEGVDCEIDNDFGDDCDTETNGFGGEDVAAIRVESAFCYCDRDLFELCLCKLGLCSGWSRKCDASEHQTCGLQFPQNGYVLE